MAYFLRKLKRKNDKYLQIYYAYFDKKIKQPRNKHCQTLGYYKDLKNKGIKDPIKHAQNIVNKLNKKEREEKEENKIRKITDKSLNLNIGYFLIKSAIDYLAIDDVVNILCEEKKFQFKPSDMLRALIYSQILCPCSKYKMSNEVIPSMYNIEKYSPDQIYDFLEYIGGDYKKYIELFNSQLLLRAKRDFNVMFFDCTNYYFEIDLPSEDKQDGPSKENRRSPIIGQALLLDGNTIPLNMEMYPGNKNEQPYIRYLIKDTITRYGIKNKVIQVADKGLNSAKNIYYAKKNYGGYIFSKKIRGKALNQQEKNWITSSIGYKDVIDNNGEIKYKIKECVDMFHYEFIDDDMKKVSFKIREKRVVTYNPSLAKKHRAEITKLIEKAKYVSSIKEASKDDYGAAIKYVIFKSKNKNDEDINIESNLNYEKIEEDLKYCGYNLLITSEYNLSSDDIYKAYHNLSRIEECFRISKSVLEARPVFVRNKETIYGHFLICFLSLFILRFLEVHVYNFELNIYDIVNFIRSFNVTQINEDNFINTMRANNNWFFKIKDRLKINLIERLNYSTTELNKILKYKI